MLTFVHAQGYEYEVNEKLFLQSKFTTPSSPEVASLGKYGDYQVNTFTGGLSLSIPVVGMNDRIVGYQMSLNYDGSGNKVEILPSWAGLGWSLSGVPLISRSVKGKPDTQGNYFSKSSEINSNVVVNNDLGELYEFYQDVEDGIIETIPDEYNLSFPGGSAKFFISHQKKVVMTEQKDIEIIPSYPTSGAPSDEVSGFTVVDPQGNVYNFTITEKTHVTENDDETSNNETYEYISAFYCSSINSMKNSDHLIFSYETKDQEEYFNDINNEKHIIKKYPASTGSTNCQACQSSGTFLSSPFEERLRKRRFLSQIDYYLGGNHVEKIKINSVDHDAEFRREYDRKIVDIQYFSGNLSIPKHTIKFDFDDSQSRLMLDGIETEGHDGTIANKYSFDYTPVQLPKASSSSIDAWGYFNFNSENSSLIPTVNFVGEGANRSPSLNRAEASILKTITYPTGGYTEFEYELHHGKFGDNQAATFEDVGGLRMKSISTFDESSNLILAKNYKYEDDLGGENGKIFVNMQFQKTETFKYEAPTVFGGCLGSCCDYECFSYKNYSTNTATAAFINGTHIGYPRVVEILSDKNVSYGKNVYHFSLDFDLSDMDNPQLGNLMRKEVYDNAENLLQEIENTYTHTYSSNNLFKSYSVVPSLNQDNKKYLITVSSGVYKWTQESSNWPVYNTKYMQDDFKTIKTHINVLSNTTQKDYFNGEVITKTTDYAYDNDYKIILPKIVTVKDENDLTKIYETQYSGLGGSVIAYQMENAHILHQELSVKVNNGLGGGAKMDYILEGVDDKFVPKEIHQYREDGSLKFKAKIDEYQDQYLPQKITTNTQPSFRTLDYFTGPKTGLLMKSTYGARETDYTWNGFRELDSATDFNDIVSTFTYDGVGRLKTSTLQNGRIHKINTYHQAHSNGIENSISSRVSYPLDSNIPFIVYQSKFDGIGRKVEDIKHGYTQSGGKYITSSIYNGLNSVIYATDPGSGGTTENVYESSPLQRMQTSTPPGSPSPISTTYGTNSESIGGYAPFTLYKNSTTDENGLVSASYSDIFGRQIATVTDENGLNLMTVYTYNDRDQVLTIQPPGGGEQYVYTYYPDGLLHTKSIPDKGTYTYTYNAQDQIQTESQPNGKTLSYVYDPVYNDFLKTVTLDNTDVIINNTMIGISGWIASEAAAIFDENGLTGSFAFNIYQNHDDIGRPVNETRQYGNGTSDFTYTYDDANNITQTIRNHTSPLGSVNYSMNSKFDKGIRNIYNEMDIEGLTLGISDLIFDDREWLQSKTLGGGLQTIAYDYNPRGWLTQINSVESTIPDYVPCDDTDDQPLCDCLGPYDVHSLDIFYNCLEMATGQPTNVTVNITSSTINGETQSVFDEQTIVIPFNGGTYEESASYPNNIALDLGGGLGGENGGGNPGQGIDDVLQFILDCIDAAGTEENPDTPGGTFGTLQYAIFDVLGIDAEGELPDNPGSNSEANLFGMELHYFDGNSELNAPPQYNGNISWVEWANFREPVQRYGYTYDGANRLLAAKYEAEKIETCEKMFQGVYDVVISDYDDRGNIQGIRRNGITEIINDVPTFGLIDDLSYTYNGNTNLLDRVENNAITDFGFASGVANYTYVTGNLHTDSGKKITNMAYNYMDLPLKIEIEGNTVYNTYDANGRKLKSKIVSNSPDHESVTYTYMDGIEYKDESLEAVYHSEGRFIFDKEDQNYYEFFLKDHLGNTRVRFADKNNSGKLAIEPLEVEEVPGVELQYQEYLGAKSYYPFGMAFSHNAITTEDGNLFWVDEEGGVKNKYTYNGKEFIDDLGVNWHYYGFRIYDPAIARFTSVDPIADQFAFVSSFNYAENSPIANIDLHGLQAVFFQVAGRIGIGAPIGPTVSTAFGIAIDTDLNMLVYNTTTAGLSAGAFAGAGGEIGVNFGVENIDGLLGWGGSVGLAASTTLLPGPQGGIEGNISIATDKDGSIPEFGDNGYGVTIAPPGLGGAVGFLGYGEASYTSEIARFTPSDIQSAIETFIDQYAEPLNDEQKETIINQIREIQKQAIDLSEKK